VRSKPFFRQSLHRQPRSRARTGVLIRVSLANWRRPSGPRFRCRPQHQTTVTKESAGVLPPPPPTAEPAAASAQGGQGKWRKRTRGGHWKRMEARVSRDPSILAGKRCRQTALRADLTSVRARSPLRCRSRLENPTGPPCARSWRLRPSRIAASQQVWSLLLPGLFQDRTAIGRDGWPINGNPWRHDPRQAPVRMATSGIESVVSCCGNNGDG